MAGDNYFITNQYTPYFLTCTVIRWIDVFTRKTYKDIIVDSQNYCAQHKGLELYAWVIMSNHIHLVAKVNPPLGMSGFLRDFKKFTSKKIVAAIIEEPESLILKLVLNLIQYLGAKRKRCGSESAVQLQAKLIKNTLQNKRQILSISFHCTAEISE